MRNSLACSCIALFCVISVGCSKSQPRVYPVNGEVFFNGEPAWGAVVHFHPVEKDDSSPAAAIVEDDGTFQLTTRTESDGAREGDYIVTVNWCDEKEVDGETIIGPDKLKGRYGKPDTSILRATVTIGHNSIPRFELSN